MWGFGNIAGEFWLGNEYVHQLTTKHRHTLRMGATDFDNNTRFIQYTGFYLESNTSNYKFKYDSCNGGECALDVNNMKSMDFSTPDNDKD